MATIKWNNNQLYDWEELNGLKDLSTGYVIYAHFRNLSDKSGGVSIVFTADKTNNSKWEAKFLRSLNHLNSIFNENYHNIYSEHQVQDMKDYVDEFLIRMDNLRVYS